MLDLALEAHFSTDSLIEYLTNSIQRNALDFIFYPKVFCRYSSRVLGAKSAHENRYEFMIKVLDFYLDNQSKIV